MTCQSWQSEKNSAAQPTRVWPEVESRIFFGSPTLTGHSFAAPWAMMIKSGSFESPKPYLLVHNLKNSRMPLLTSVRTSWKVAIYNIKGVLMILNRTPPVKSQLTKTVNRHGWCYNTDVTANNAMWVAVLLKLFLWRHNVRSTIQTWDIHFHCLLLGAS